MTRLLTTTSALICAALFSLAAQAQSTGDSGSTPDPAPAGDSTDKSIATFDVDTGELRISCLEVTGIKVKGQPIDAQYDVVMIQRGNSSNWEITFLNEDCGGKLPAATNQSSGNQ